MPSSEPIHNRQTEASLRGRQLAMMGYAGTAILAGWFWFAAPWHNPVLLSLALGILTLGVMPMLQWLKRSDLAHPLPEVLQLTLVPFYAIPLLFEHDAVMNYTESTLITATLLVMLFQIGTLVGAIFADRTFIRHTQSSWLESEIVSENNTDLITYALIATTFWMFISSYTRWIPAEFVGTLRAIFFGIGTLCAFIQARMWGNGQLSPTQKALFVLNIVIQIILNSLGLLLVTGLIIFLLAMVGYFSTARRLPWKTGLLALIIFSVFHNGKYKMRERHWGEDSMPVSLLTTPAYLAEWIGYGLPTENDAEQEEHRTSHTSLFQRASLIQIVSYAVEVVPEKTPHFAGSTYKIIPPQIIPRFLWPNKPSPNDSVKQLSVGLGILSENEAETTSIGFGLIAESYVNFGFYGTGLLGLVLGWALRWLALRASDCTALSFGGILRILALSWCLNTETTLAVWLSSFYQACVAIFVPLLIVRLFLKQSDAP